MPLHPAAHLAWASARALPGRGRGAGRAGAALSVPLDASWAVLEAALEAQVSRCGLEGVERQERGQQDSRGQAGCQLMPVQQGRAALGTSGAGLRVPSLYGVSDAFTQIHQAQPSQGRGRRSCRSPEGSPGAGPRPPHTPPSPGPAR